MHAMIILVFYKAFQICMHGQTSLDMVQPLREMGGWGTLLGLNSYQWYLTSDYMSLYEYH